MIWGLLIYVFNFWKFRGSFLSLIFGFWKFLKCILNQNSYFWGGVCFMNFLIWGFLNDFINSSGIIFEFHYNFIIFFCVWVPRFYTKNFNFFLPPIPPKKWLFWQNLAILALFGTFWIFFDHLYPPKKTKKYYIGTILPFWHFLALLGFFLPRITHKKNQKMNILTKFGHFGTSWHCSDFFLPPIPPKNPKNGYFGKIWPFCHFLALFWGGVKIAKKKIMLFKYSPLATQNSKNFYTHCFLSFLR